MHYSRLILSSLLYAQFMVMALYVKKSSLIAGADPVFCSQDALDGLIAKGIEGCIFPNAFLDLLESGFDGRAFVADQDLVDFG